MPDEVQTPNPNRVAAGRLNRMKRKGVTPEGRERLRLAALKHRPWRFSTGPKTELGKKRVALNGLKRAAGGVSMRKLRSQMAEVRKLMSEMQATRQQISP